MKKNNKKQKVEQFVLETGKYLFLLLIVILITEISYLRMQIKIVPKRRRKWK
jgi:hypothetical protein